MDKPISSYRVNNKEIKLYTFHKNPVQKYLKSFPTFQYNFIKKLFHVGMLLRLEKYTRFQLIAYCYPTCNRAVSNWVL